MSVVERRKELRARGRPEPGTGRQSQVPGKFFSVLLWTLAVINVAAILGTAAWVGYRTWPRQLPLPANPVPSVRLESGRLAVPLAPDVLLGDVGTFDNELSAYLWFDYLRSRPGVQVSDVLLVVTERGRVPAYKIQVVLPNDALTAIPFLASLEAKGYVAHFDLAFSSEAAVEYGRKQTQVFVAAYRRPVDERLENLPAKQLLKNTARFLAFKSHTDPRILARNGEQVAALSSEQANDLAADIIAVAKFYDLPLDVFLGIGAMENNYLNVDGDINHSIWKRRPAPGDIILKRRRHRVLVSDYSIGVWQITRETLRYAHGLFLKDTRDYSQLPERLVPPRKLELDLTDSHVLTTYAGLLLRDLLDHFDGNIEKAVGAYNGGRNKPNPDYAAGVQLVSTYARNVLERVAAQNERATKESLAIAGVYRRH